jgi:hypothetical protein
VSDFALEQTPAGAEICLHWGKADIRLNDIPRQNYAIKNGSQASIFFDHLVGDGEMYREHCHAECLRAVELITSSNLVGCTTKRSLCLAPPKPQSI